MAENASAYVSHEPTTYNPALNPYRAKNVWPPDFSKLSPRYQLRLERRYKRRAQLKWARPRLMAWTRLAQWTGGLGVLVYGIFFMDWGREMRRPGEVGNGPFEGARAWLKDTVEDLQGVRGHDVERVRQGEKNTGG